MSGERLDAVNAELADVFIYLVRLADVLHVDLLEAAIAKVAINDQRYTVERSMGSARKVD